MFRNRMLKIVALMMEVVACLVLIAAVVSAVIILLTGGQPGSPRGMSVVALIVGILYFSVLVALAGIVRLLMNIERNTKLIEEEEIE